MRETKELYPGRFCWSGKKRNSVFFVFGVACLAARNLKLSPGLLKFLLDAKRMDADDSVISMNISWVDETSYYALVKGSKNRTIDSLVRTWELNPGAPTIEEVQQKILNESKGFVWSIDRIYYINLDHRLLRRAIMENWLSKQPIPYQRVSAFQGDSDVCVEEKHGTPCIGISGVARSNLHIMDHLSTKGITLVLEDDIVIKDMDKLLTSVNLVPPDWDILRWDCWGDPLPGFQHFNFSFKVNPRNYTFCKENNIQKCWFCGGNHIAMWRGDETVKKLRTIWGAKPHDDIDCRLADPRPGEPSLNSYCINVGAGVFQLPLSEKSDIEKIDEV